MQSYGLHIHIIYNLLILVSSAIECCSMQGEGTSSMSLGHRSTESTFTVEADTGTHTFEIDDYNLTKNLISVGNFTRSTTFNVGGVNWAIRFYPNSTCLLFRNSVAVCLELMSSNAEVSAHYNIQFMGSRYPKMDSQLSWLSSEASCLFSSSDLSDGSYLPIRHMGYLLRDLLEQWFVHNDHVTIHCDLTVIRKPTLFQNMAQTEISIPPSDFTMHFGKLLEDKKGADVTFVVEGQNFDAHKAVLAARSPVFMEKFYGSMTRETETGSVIVEDMKPLVFKSLLHFIYTDMLLETFDPLGHDYIEMIKNLLVAADTYAMDRLKLMCESILAKKLSIENVDEFMDIAQRHSGHKLKEACIEFMASLSERDFTRTCGKIKSSDSSFLIAVFDRIKRIKKN